MAKLKKGKGVVSVSIDSFKRHIGRRCQITTILDKKISGMISRVDGNWIEIETRKGVELVNTEFIERLNVISGS